MGLQLLPFTKYFPLLLGQVRLLIGSAAVLLWTAPAIARDDVDYSRPQCVCVLCSSHAHAPAQVNGPSVYRSYLAAARNLGLSDAASGYWELHIREDERHGRQMVEDVALPLVDM